MTDSKKILIADDHRQSRMAFAKIINDHSDWELCGEISYTDDLINMAEKLRPDIVIIDIYMPAQKNGEVNYGTIESQNGLRQGLKLKNKYPEIGIIFTSIFVHEAAIQLIYKSKLEGGLGFVHKDADENEVFTVIQRVAQGYRQVNFEASRSVIVNKKQQLALNKGILKIFTERELEVLRIIAQGFSRDQAAKSLGVSPGLLDKHIGHIREKLREKNVIIGDSTEYSYVHLTHLALSEGIIDILSVEEKI